MAVMMTKMTKSTREVATLSMGNTQQLWKMLGASLYRERPLLPITIRELLQNSIDAQKAKGIDNPIELNVFYDSKKNIIFEFIDKGIGMDEQTILNKFLALGESGKAGINNVGGFGIAKASIIGACSSWKLETQDNYLDSGMLGVCPIQKTNNYIDGCKITLQYDKTEVNESLVLGYDFLAQSIKYLITSDVNIHLTATDETTVSKTFLQGIKIDEKLFVSEIKTDAYNAKVYLAPSIKRQYPQMNKTYISEKTNVTISGKIIYRIQGLTQFINYGINGDFNIIVDVTPFVGVTDPNYPFTNSRERANYNFSSLVDKVINKYIENPVTTANLIKKLLKDENQEKVKFYDGKAFTVPTIPLQKMLDKDIEEEKNSIEVIEKEAKDVILKETIEDIEDSIQALPELEAVFVKTKEISKPKVNKILAISETSLNSIDRVITQKEKSPYTFQMCIKYKDDKDLKKLSKPRYAKILRVWAELIQKLKQAAPNGYQSEFAIGFIISEYQTSERYYVSDDYTTYFLINPTNLKITSGLNTVLKMLQEAAHLLAHAKNYSHDENFTIACQMLYNNFLDKYGIKTLKQLNKLLLYGK